MYVILTVSKKEEGLMIFFGNVLMYLHHLAFVMLKGEASIVVRALFADPSPTSLAPLPHLENSTRVSITGNTVPGQGFRRLFALVMKMYILYSMEILRSSKKSETDLTASGIRLCIFDLEERNG
jgi:hypothetical protein